MIASDPTTAASVLSGALSVLPGTLSVPADVGIGVVVVLALEAVGGLLLVSLLGAAAVRRRERPYVLLTLGASTLVARAFVGVLALAGVLGGTTLLTLDHGLDVVLVAFVIGAVYTAREIGGPEVGV